MDAAAQADPFALQNEMIRALTGGAAAGPLQAAELQFTGDEQGVRLQFTAPCSGPCYLAIPGTDELLPADVQVNGALLGEYFTIDSLGGVMPLGNFAAGQTVEVYLGFDADAQERDAICIYSLDETAMAAAAAWLQAGAPQDLAIREGGAIDLTAEGSPEKDLLVLPFAWEDAAHWQLTVNGEAAVLEPVFGGWMGVRLQPGAQTVRLRYRHPGAALGLAGSGAAVLAALGWRMAEKRRAPAAANRKQEKGETP